MGIAKCALFGDRRENKKEACQFGPVLWVHLAAFRCAAQGPPVTVFRICESLSLVLSKFSRFCEISNARVHKLFLQNYNIESNSALKYFYTLTGSPTTRDSIISLLFIIRIIVLLINRAFYFMHLPYPRLSSDIIISRFIFDIAISILRGNVPLLSGDQTYV